MARLRFTLAETTALYLAVLAAQDNVPAGLSAGTLSVLTRVKSKLDPDLEALARPPVRR